MDLTAALPTFVITLREGFEAALVVGIVLACLKRAGQTRLNSWVYAGVGAGIVASALVGVLLSGVLQALNRSDRADAAVVKPLLEAGLCLVAIALLSWMLIWMTQQARSLKAEVEGAVGAALQQNTNSAAWGIFGLIFIAVLREGFETVVFIVAKFQQGWIPAVGALAGLAVAALLGVLLFQLGVKIDIRLFFQVMGIFLLLIVSGLVISALKHVEGAVSTLAQFQSQFASWCHAGSDSCVLGPKVWDLTTRLPDKQFPGILLKSLLGYRDTLYLGQAVGYVLFLITAVGFYFQSLSDRSMGGKTPTTSDSN